jgi:uncharacterized protein (TIGR02246 family)
MKSRSALALFVLLLPFGWMGCRPAEDAPADAAAAADTTAAADDLAVARAALEAWDPAFLTANADTIAALYTEDAARLNADTPVSLGRAAIREGFVREFASQTPTTSVNTIAEVVVAGDWAWARGPFTYSGTYANTSETVEDKGKWLSVRRRTSEGWPTLVDAWNSDNPYTGEAPPPLGALVLPPAEERIDGPPADVEALRAMVTAWETATLAGDADGHAARYAADAVRMNDRGTTNVGVDAIRASYAADPGGYQAAKATVDAIEVDGDWAWARGHFGASWTTPEGQTGHTVGKWLNVLQRTPEGWKVKAEIWNLDQPAQPAPAPVA